MSVDVVRNLLVGLANVNAKAEFNLTGPKLFGDPCLIKVDTLNFQQHLPAKEPTGETENNISLYPPKLVVAALDGTSQSITIPNDRTSPEIRVEISELLPYRLLPYYVFDNNRILPYSLVVGERVRLVVPDIPRVGEPYMIETQLFAKQQRVLIAVSAELRLTIKVGVNEEIVQLNMPNRISNYTYDARQLELGIPHTLGGTTREALNVSADAYAALIKLTVTHNHFPEEYHFLALPRRN